MKKKGFQFKKFQPVRVTWVDSVHHSGWQRESACNDEGSIEYETVGLFGRETQRTVQIFQSRCLETSEEDDYLIDGVMQIPKVAILSIKKL